MQITEEHGTETHSAEFRGRMGILSLGLHQGISTALSHLQHKEKPQSLWFFAKS